MKKVGTLNRNLSAVLSCMGHTDLLTICDGGFPCPQTVPCIDLALRGGLPSFLDTLDVILTELQVEKLIIARETREVSPTMYGAILKRFPGLPVEEMPHVEFKAVAVRARATVRTGEFTPYANLILQSGVVY
jgi:D-ribose pyranase